MLKNYFTIAVNNLLKNKLYSAINIVGLAIGLAACIVITLYVKNQYSYDRQWKDSDRIYRVNWSGANHNKFAFTPMPSMPLLHEYFKDKIEKSARTYSNSMVIDVGTTQFKDTLVMVDPSFSELFQIEEISGSLKKTLTNPSSIALSAETAKKYFGNEQPIGKDITAKISGISILYKVTAIYRINGNTILDIPLMSLLQENGLPSSQNNWQSYNTAAYFKLKNGIDIEALNLLTPAFIDIYKESPYLNQKASDLYSIEFQRLKEAHLNSHWDLSRAGGNKTVVICFACVSLLVLLIGSMNFTILTVAKATQRAREVAMRKVVGAKRKQLISQFLGESILIVLMAMLLSLSIVEIMLPVFTTIVGIKLSLDYTSPSTIYLLMSLLLVLGLIGGFFPAFILSGFRPGEILRANHSKEPHKSISMRNVLVICQFTISTILIIATSVIYAQLHHSINHDHGYNKDNLLTIYQLQQHLFPEIRDKLAPLKLELQKLPNVSDVGFSNLQPSHQKSNSYTFARSDQPGITHTIPWIRVDYDFFKVYQIPFIAGRNYSAERDIPAPIFDFWTESIAGTAGDFFEKNLIMNRKAVKELGYANPEEALGKTITYANGNKVRYAIIGIVEDNHMFSINAPPRAEVYLLDPVQIDTIAVRFNGSPKRIIEQVETVWKNVMGDIEIHTAFVNQQVAQEFEQEQTAGKILIGFSILAIIIACMGLYGTASFTVDRRTREIGLRKVMGAKVKNIISLLIWQFSKPVLIANIIAWPVAIFVMQSWLERFAYRFNPLFMIPICIGSGLIALAIACFTVAGNTTRVAKSNPIKALRYE